MKKKTVKKQTKSKERIRDHGEVFTAEREVKAMCDLVKDETERIDSRFLEPACGDGNFLAEILTRKLAVVRKKYGKSHLDYEKNAVQAARCRGAIKRLQNCSPKMTTTKSQNSNRCSTPSRAMKANF